MKPLRRVPLHRALVRPPQLLGCDRTLVFVLGLLCSALVVPAGIGRGELRLVALGVVLFFVGMGLLSQMSKADPQMREVFLRSVLYAERYVARARVDRPAEPRGLTSKGPFLSRRWW